MRIKNLAIYIMLLIIAVLAINAFYNIGYDEGYTDMYERYDVLRSESDEVEDRFYNHMVIEQQFYVDLIKNCDKNNNHTECLKVINERIFPSCILHVKEFKEGVCFNGEDLWECSWKTDFNYECGRLNHD